MAYSFGSSFPAYGSFGGLQGFGGYAVPSTSYGSTLAPTTFAAPASYGSALAPTAFGGYTTNSFGAAFAPTTTWGGLGGYGSVPTASFGGLTTAPTAYGSNFAPTVFGTSAPWATGAQWGFAPGQAGLQTPQPGQEGPVVLNANGARTRAASNITFGAFGVPTMVSAEEEERLTKSPSSGNMPFRSASKGELAGRQRSFTGGQGAQAMSQYLQQSGSVDPQMAQRISSSAFQVRNLAAPTGHRGTNPRDVVPF